MKKIITASLVAMMAVTAAHADIASTTYVDSRTGDVENSTFVKTLETGKKNLSGAVDALAGKLSSGNLTIANGAVGTDQLADDAVTADKLAPDSVLSDNIKNGEVKTDDIADLNVTTAKIADSAVTSAKIADGTIVDEDISANANIAQSKIAGLEDALADKEDVSNKASQVTDGMNKAQMYPTVALTESLISLANQDMSDVIGDVADGKTVVQMITEGDSALGQRVTTIEGSAYAKSGITSTKVGAYDDHVADTDIHVTTTDKSRWDAKQDKLTASNVTTEGATGVVKAVVGSDGKLSVTKSAVATDDIAASAVTTEKIADLNVTTAKIANTAVTTDKIAANAVTTAKIADGNVTSAKLASDVQTSLDNADSAVQRTQVGMDLNFAIDAKCKAEGVVCSLVVRGDGTNATASWEVVAK